MKKNIVLCSDGTGNQAIKGRGTNVFKLYESIDKHHSTPQLAFYDDGVGTESNKFLKTLGGAFGYGLSRNVRYLYSELARCYRPGDDIYLFGFSRGAYTVRTLAAFITKCGVLDISKCKNDKEILHYIKGGYKAYRRDYKNVTNVVWRALFDWLARLRFKFTQVEEFKKFTHEEGNTPVHFIGVWDTVSAVGFPVMGVATFIDNVIYKFRFPNNELDPKVEQACHAVSIDEKRKTFHPEMWDERKESSRRIQQVWFAGVHSNVGGGYPKHGMSLVALDWMMKKAHAAGLQFIEEDLAYYAHHADVHDKLYDSRSGISVYYRYEPRNIYKICQENGITPMIHDSVYHRSRALTEGYAPGNLPNNLNFVSSSEEGFVLQNEAAAIRDAMGDDTTLLSRVASVLSFRKLLQTIFYVLSAVVVYLLIQEYSVSIIASLVSDPGAMGIWLKLAKVMLHVSLIVPALIVVWLSGSLRGKIQDVFSSFWYKFKPEE